MFVVQDSPEVLVKSASSARTSGLFVEDGDAVGVALGEYEEGKLEGRPGISVG